MSLESNKAVVRRYFDEILSKGNFEVIKELTTPDVAIWIATIPGGMHGTDGAIAFVKGIRDAFPDATFTPEPGRLIADGDRVGARWNFHGTSTNQFIAFPANGRHISDHGIDIFRIQDGKIAELWINQDTLGLLQQLDVIPSAEKVEAQNREIAHRFFSGAWGGDFAIVDELIPPDALDHSNIPGKGADHGPDSFKGIIGMFRGACPDIKLTIMDEVVEGNKVVHRWALDGNFTGTPLFGVPAQNKPIHFGGTTTVRIEGGKIVERWSNLDELGLMVQLGVVPPPGGGN